MTEPWGISGPDFLRSYLVGFAFALLFAFAARILVRTGTSTERDFAGTVRHDQLTLDELAYLAGGARRVAETSVARLIDGGKLRSARNGAVQAVAGATATDAVDRAVLNDTKRFGTRTIRLLVDRVSGDDAVRRTASALTGKGLLVDRVAARARFAVVPLGLLAVAGVARWVEGVGADRPVGWLSLLLLVNAGAIVVLLRLPGCERTFAGDRVLREARASVPRSRKILHEGSLDTPVLLAGAGGMVALGGLAAYPDEVVRSTFALQQPSASSGGGYVGCSSAGGSSCGGGGSGGCGGGGCGG